MSLPPAWQRLNEMSRQRIILKKRRHYHVYESYIGDTVAIWRNHDLSVRWYSPTKRRLIYWHIARRVNGCSAYSGGGRGELRRSPRCPNHWPNKLIMLRPYEMGGVVYIRGEAGEVAEVRAILSPLSPFLSLSLHRYRRQRRSRSTICETALYFHPRLFRPLFREIGGCLCVIQ
jgi:hypothetical protein